MVLAIVTGIWGGLLSLVKMATEDQIEYQRLKNIKAPALREALTVNYTNDPIQDRTSVTIGKDKSGKPIERTIFYAKKDNQIVAIAFEAYGTGYEGDIGVMVSIRVTDDKIGGIGVTTHSETPGVGTKAINSPKFINQFKNKSINTNFSPRGGTIDAYSGATYTSNGIMKAVQNAIEIYKEFKTKIISEDNKKSKLNSGSHLVYLYTTTPILEG